MDEQTELLIFGLLDAGRSTKAIAAMTLATRADVRACRVRWLIERERPMDPAGGPTRRAFEERMYGPPAPCPTPEAIRWYCRRIQATWTKTEERKRAGHPDLTWIAPEYPDSVFGEYPPPDLFDFPG